MCGPAGSGKTTWVREHANPGHSAHISRDRIRFNMVKEDEYYFSREDEVYDEFVYQIVQALRSPWVDSVYADATHLTAKAREKLIRKINTLCSAASYDLTAVVVMPELKICLAQNAQRTGRENVPETVIRNMYNSFQHPLNDEFKYNYIIENDEIVYGEVE
jgi:predicted kinase